MAEPVIEYSLSNFRQIILQALDQAGARRVVEIGSEFGSFTRELLERARRTGGQLIAVDPASPEDGAAFSKEYGGDPHFELVEQTILEALPLLSDVDAYIVDSDHNYYTARRELDAIGAHQKRCGRSLLIFEHDVGLPWGRRDLYYAPDRIPEHSRHPYSRASGFNLGESQLRSGGSSDAPGLAVALGEGGKQNGVLTAIEDFLAEQPALRFKLIPALFGLGILYSGEAPWAAALADMLTPFCDGAHLERTERSRTRLFSKVHELIQGKESAERAPSAGFLFGPALLEIFSIQDSSTFQRLYNYRLAPSLREQEALIPGGHSEFRLPGFCIVCGKPSLFTTDHQYAGRDAAGKTVLSWRERQVCACGMNCRQRSSFHVLTQLPGLTRDAKVYCTEQGALFQHIRRAFRGAQGSEYLGSRVPLGATAPNGVRNEDLTQLTFGDKSFDSIFSLDVLEHVPDYRLSLREMARCLRPGGWLLMTTPIHFWKKTTVTRAEIGSDGNIVHHLPPVYHGDPIDSRGVLCFHDFGWDILDSMREAGFADPELTLFTAPHYGYIGLQYVILATRDSH